MRRSNTQPLGDVIQQYLKAMDVDSKLKEIRVLKQWENMLGKSVAKVTTNLYIKNKVLFVHLSSSVVRNELAMIKEGIIKRINEIAEEELITDIVFR